MTFDVNTIPNIFDIVFKGLLIGIIASAPMGPVGVLCVQRTLNKGRWYGFVTGCGAALSDMIYAGITGLGMGLVVDFVSNDTTRFYLQIAGSIMLLLFGSIASVGVQHMIQHKIDFDVTRNIIIASVTLTIGIGGAILTFGTFSISGIGLSAVVGVLLNLLLPRK